MVKIKQQAMTGTGVDMCNIPVNESYGSGYRIMVYRKDDTGEILNSTPEQPNLLVSHKNGLYMSGYQDLHAAQLVWILLNKGDGSDILTTTTTTTTTTPKPTQYTVSGTFAVRLFSPQMVMFDLMGNEIPVTVEFTGANGQLITSYSGYRITTTFNPAGYNLRVSGRDAMLLGQGNYWAGQINLLRLPFWSHDASTGDYSTICNFTSSILTTTTTTTTTTAAPTTYEYTIQVNSTSADLSRLEVSVSNSQTLSFLVAGSKNRDGSWTFNWRSRVDVPSGWKFEFAGTGTNQREYTATLTNRTFVEGVCTISSLILLTSRPNITDPLRPTVETIGPFSVDNPEDTNSLDDAINDYLNEQ